MSSAVVSTSAASGRLFVFDEDDEVNPYVAHPEPFIQPAHNQRFPPASITSASRLIRPAPEMASSGISALDALTGGLPRGCLTEICGAASSGRTTVLLATLAAATRRGEFCAVIDASDALDPHSAAAAGIELDKLLWVRCGEDSPRKDNSPQSHPSTSLRAGTVTEKNIFRNKKSHTSHSESLLAQVLRATDLLVESGGFGLIVLDLADMPLEAARRIPLTTWFRFRRAIEHKPTVLLAIEQQPIAGSCSSLLLRLGVPSTQYPVPSASLSHAQLLTAVHIHAELIRSRLERKPARSIAFETKMAWVG